MKKYFVAIVLVLLFQTITILPVFSQESVSTKLESYKALTYDGKAIPDSLGLPQNTMPGFGKQVDDAIRFSDAIGMLAAAQVLYSFEQLENKKCSFLCSDSLFAWSIRLLLFKKSESQLSLTELKYLQQTLLKAGRKFTDKEQSIFNERMKTLTGKPPRVRGDISDEASVLTIKNESSDVLYVYENSVYLGKVYKDRDFTFQFSPGCHDLSVESPQMKRSGKSWCLRGRQLYNWKVE